MPQNRRFFFVGLLMSDLTNRPYKDIIWAFDIVIIEKDGIGTERSEET